MSAAKHVEYTPPPEFEEVDKDPLIELNLTDSTELWLLQWPINQAPHFDGKEISLKLNSDGNLGTFKGSSGKSYDLVSFKSQEADATVFLPTASDSKIAILNRCSSCSTLLFGGGWVRNVGKISRRVSLVHYPDPSEYKKDDKLNVKQMAQRAATSMTNSASHFTTPTQGTKSRSLRAVSGYTTSMHTSREKSSILAGEQSKHSKRRQGDDPTRTLDQSLQDSGRGHSGVTTGSEDSLQTKSKKSKKK